jgi:Ca2+-binding EF-hand superfamily protein
MKKYSYPIALLATGLAATAFAQAVSSQAPTDEELAVLPEFEAVDANENGRIEAGETEDLAKMLNDQHQIAFQFEAVDRNRDGLINPQEYVAYDGVLKERLGIA